MRSLGWVADDLRSLGKWGALDDEVYDLARAGGYALVTYDLAFSRRFMIGSDLPGLILLRVHPQTIEVLHPVLQDFLKRVKPEDLGGVIATVTNDRYRLRVPGGRSRP